jgi:hypothetical protein
MKGCGTGINRKGAKMQWEAEPHNNLQLKGECFGWQNIAKLSCKNEWKKSKSKRKDSSVQQCCFSPFHFLQLDAFSDGY